MADFAQDSIKRRLVELGGDGSEAKLIWLWLHQDGRQSRQTRRAYWSDLKQLVNAVRMPLLHAHAVDLVAYVQTETMQSYAKRTRSRKISSIRSFYAYCVAQGHLDADPSCILLRPLPHAGVAIRVMRNVDRRTVATQHPSDQKG